jgi:polysaccharide export outer membrane protein
MNMPVCKTISRIPLYPVYILLVYFFTSCKTSNNLGYFQTISRDTTLQNNISKNFELKLKQDDLLSIGIASASAELSALYNAPQASAGGGNSPAGYLVDKKGTIQLYKLGDIRVAGLTRTELKEKLQKDLEPYLKDPVVTVRLLNQRVTVLGEVGNPGIVTLNSDHITILEAIGQSGDLTEKAKRNNVLVIRQTEGGKEFKHLNLLDHSVFSSPYFYLQSEDVVYVEPVPAKESARTQQTLSYIISGISIISLILSRIR